MDTARFWLGLAGIAVALTGVVAFLSGHNHGLLVATAGFIGTLFAWRD